MRVLLIPSILQNSCLYSEGCSSEQFLAIVVLERAHRLLEIDQHLAHIRYQQRHDAHLTPHHLRQCGENDGVSSLRQLAYLESRHALTANRAVEHLADIRVPLQRGEQGACPLHVLGLLVQRNGILAVFEQLRPHADQIDSYLREGESHSLKPLRILCEGRKRRTRHWNGPCQ